MFRSIAAALLILIAALFAHAADVLSISGSVTRVLPDTAAGEVRFPVTYAAAAPPAVTLIEVLLDGAPASAEGWTASLGVDRFLRIAVAPDRARDAGTYGVVIRAQPATGDAQLLNVNVVRPAGELRFAFSPLRLSRTVYFWRIVDDVPDAVTLIASPRRGTVTPAQTLWSGDLRSSDTTIVGQVRISTPQRITAGTTVAAPLSVVGDPPLGTSTATVRIAAPQLAAGVVEQTVEVVSRLSSVWLLIVVALGIAVGHLVRHVLENRRLRSEALLSANSVRDDLQELARKTPDAEDLQNLQQILATLERVMRDHRSTPEQISAAAESAAVAAKEVIAMMNVIRAKSTERIAALRGVLGKPEGHVASIGAVVRDLLASIRSQEQSIAAGELRSVVRELDEIEGSLQETVYEALAQWTAELRSALTTFAAASSSPIVADSVANARALVDRVADGVEIGPRLDTAKKLASVLRVNLFKTALHEITDEATRVLDQASAAGDKSAIAAAREQVNSVSSWHAEPAGEPLHQLMVDIQAMRSAVGSIPAAPTEVALKFDPAKTAAARAAAAAATTVITSRRTTRIIVSGPAVVGERLSCRLVSVDGQLDGVANVTWQVNGVVIASEGALSVAIDLREPKLLTINADTTFVDGSNDSTSVVLHVSPLMELQSTDLLIEITRRVQWIQTIVAGLLIALSGFVIFRAHFIGTPEDLLVVFLWGFGSDVGLARVRELSAPLQERKLPSGGGPT
jgi:hypothetical protein